MSGGSQSQKAQIQRQRELAHKLLPILASIDQQKYKQGLEKAEKDLRKASATTQAGLRVAQALCLAPLGRSAEAVAAVRSMEKEAIADGYLLQLATRFWRSLGQSHEIKVLAEKAAARDPADEELQVGLLHAAILDGDVKLQQAQAGKLAASTRQPHYFYWQVYSVFQRAACPEHPSSADKLMLGLAESMLAQRFAKEGLNSPELALFYVDLLRFLQRYDDAAAFLDGPLAKSSLRVESERRRLFGDVLQLAGQSSAACDVYRALLAEEPDDYALWKALLDASGPEPSSIRSVAAYAESLAAKRSALLASVEASLRLSEAEAAVSEPHSAVHRYLARYGSKSCCARDLQPFLDALRPETRTAWIQSPTFREALFGTDPDTAERFHRMGTWAHLDWQCQGETVSETRCAEKALELLGLVGESKPVAGELGPADEVLCVAVAWMARRDRCRADARWLAVLGRILATGTSTLSTNNSALRLLNVELLGALAAAKPLAAQFKKLGVKHILLDSMTYTVLGDLALAGGLAELGALESRILRANRTALDESHEFLLEVLRHSTLSKAYEFQRFRLRCRHSYQLACVRVERLVGRLWELPASAVLAVDPLAHASEAGPAAICLPFARKDLAEVLVDNRDWGIRAGLLACDRSAPPSANVYAFREVHARLPTEKAFAVEVARLGLRSCVLVAMACAEALASKRKLALDRKAAWLQKLDEVHAAALDWADELALSDPSNPTAPWALAWVAAVCVGEKERAAGREEGGKFAENVRVLADTLERARTASAEVYERAASAGPLDAVLAALKGAAADIRGVLVLLRWGCAHWLSWPAAEPVRTVAAAWVAQLRAALPSLEALNVARALLLAEPAVFAEGDPLLLQLLSSLPPVFFSPLWTEFVHDLVFSWETSVEILLKFLSSWKL